MAKFKFFKQLSNTSPKNFQTNSCCKGLEVLPWFGNCKVKTRLSLVSRKVHSSTFSLHRFLQCKPTIIPMDLDQHLNSIDGVQNMDTTLCIYTGAHSRIQM